MTPLQYARRELHAALTEWKDAGADVEVLADYLEGFIAAKVDEILQARADISSAVSENEGK